jgi:hypothetical protein
MQYDKSQFVDDVITLVEQGERVPHGFFTVQEYFIPGYRIYGVVQSGIVIEPFGKPFIQRVENEDIFNPSETLQKAVFDAIVRLEDVRQ